MWWRPSPTWRGAIGDDGFQAVLRRGCGVGRSGSVVAAILAPRAHREGRWRRASILPTGPRGTSWPNVPAVEVSNDAARRGIPGEGGHGGGRPAGDPDGCVASAAEAG